MTILYCDRRIAVCLKPPGVLSTDEPGGMPGLLRAALGEPEGCVRTVHRLDRVVGGAMVFARSRAAAAILSEQVRERRMEKEYLAAVRGGPEEETGTFTDLLGRDPAARRTYVADGPGKDVREARLDYRVLDRAEGAGLVLVRLATGRTHQIRVQFASRGMPLLGDRRYGAGETDGCPIGLWSFRLRFAHPETGELLEFSAPPPEEEPWLRFPDRPPGAQ